jgi:pyruvate,water dikinase
MAQHPVQQHIAWFDRHDPAMEPHLGGKNTSLGIMTMAGLPVPAGFALTAEAYRLTLSETGLETELAKLVSGLDVEDGAALGRVASEARAMITGTSLPGWLVDQLDAAYETLSERRSQTDLPVAVRSSATCEDQPDASFAGEHDTYLWVRTSERVREHLLRCWASLYTERAIWYRRQMHYGEDGIAMSVGVQQMVMPRTSGVAFTLNPTNGDRSQVAIDASWGLGEAVVSGSVTPDNFLIDKVMGTITSRVISDKAVEHVLDGDDRVIEREVEEERRTAPCLTDDEVRAVAALARRAEKYYGSPQDVEWAIDPSLPADENVVLLQSRPETVWSRKKREVSEASADTFSSIVHNLLHPSGTQTVHLH